MHMTGVIPSVGVAYAHDRGDTIHACDATRGGCSHIIKTVFHMPKHQVSHHTFDQVEPGCTGAYEQFDDT